MSEADSGRDRLRELLDAVLDAGSTTLADMADHAFSSPFHFTRTLSRQTGESPVALRRRVLLERAAWKIGRGTRVTDAAFDAGYGSVEGFTRAFTRAFGHSPSATGPGSTTWVPAPNGIHFHPPVHLWVEQNPRRPTGMDVTALQVHHDVEDTSGLIELVAGLTDEQYRHEWFPGLTVLTWDGPEGSIAACLHRLVHAKEVWLASVEGGDLPDPGGDTAGELRERHARVAQRWVATTADIDRRGAWGDRIVDAICDPPESFLLGGIVAHVLTFAGHRRQMVRHMLRVCGVETDHGDPLEWLQDRNGRRGETS